MHICVGKSFDAAVNTNGKETRLFQLKSWGARYLRVRVVLCDNQTTIISSLRRGGFGKF